MRLTYLLGLAATLVLLPIAGCGEHGALSSDERGTSVSGVDASVAFAFDGPLKLEPGETALLAVVTSPPDRYGLEFRLVGESLDASLDTSKTVADEMGVALLSLRAPHQATTFAVRATIEGGPSADLVVSVSGQGYATLEVVPDYQGERPVDSWTASAVTGSTCAELAKTLPDDPEGALVVEADQGAALMIPDAPVGPALAVAVRTSRYAWGCTDVAGVMAGSLTKVVVHVANKSIDASESSLDVSLEFAPEPSSWDGLLTVHRSAMFARFESNGTAGATLLDAMLAAAPELALEPADTPGWLDALDAHFAGEVGGPIALLESLGATSSASLPPISGRAEGIDDGHALFLLESIGKLSASDSGAPTEFLMKLSVDPNDRVHLGGALSMLPSRYLGATLAAAANAESPMTPTVVDYLADKLGCSGLPLEPLPTCDAACIATLCRQGLESIWSESLDVSAALGLPAEVLLTATGDAQFDSDARLLGFSGAWLGQAKSGASSVKLGGQAMAVPAGAPEAD